MQIILYVNHSERNAINKVIDSDNTLTGSLRSESSVITPSFVVEIENPSNYNYCYIEAFHRYYFISDITSIRTGIWKIDCTVDVLMSFKTDILNLYVTVNHNSAPNQECYMSGDVWKSTVKTKTDVINFPTGLLDSGEYILITSGGVAGGA